MQCTDKQSLAFLWKQSHNSRNSRFSLYQNDGRFKESIHMKSLEQIYHRLKYEHDLTICLVFYFLKSTFTNCPRNSRNFFVLQIHILYAWMTKFIIFMNHASQVKTTTICLHLWIKNLIKNYSKVPKGSGGSKFARQLQGVQVCQGSKFAQRVSRVQVCQQVPGGPSVPDGSWGSKCTNWFPGV